MANSSSDKPEKKRKWTKESTRKRLATLKANKLAKQMQLDPIGSMLAHRDTARKGGRVESSQLHPSGETIEARRNRLFVETQAERNGLTVTPEIDQLAKLVVAVWKLL